MSVLLLYALNITSRLAYIVNTLFDKDAVLTTDLNEFLSFTGARINYTPQRITANELWICPYGLLDEKNIHHQQIVCFEWNGLKAFFRTGGDIPFDILSASFYLISRYEEYLPYVTDEYGRYAHTNSLAFKENFLHLPLINLWLKELEKLLSNRFSSAIISQSSFAFIPTYDIDIAYSYQHKGLVRNVLGFCKDIVTLNINKVKERIAVLSNKRPDPYDVYSELNELHEETHIIPFYFFLLAEKTKLYDRNIDPCNEAMHALIKQHAALYKVGIHPSWQSGDDEQLLKEEIDSLGKILETGITISRQHYIRMRFPETYQKLIANDIREDFSMGYGSINGFRASICNAFLWYDLKNEQSSNLLIHPFCFMDANACFEQKLTAEQASHELQQYFDIVKSAGGEMITIFHNNFLTQQKQWIKWSEMYAAFLRKNL